MMEVLLRLLVTQVILLALATSFVSCYDPNPLQDFCVAASETNRGIISNIASLVFGSRISLSLLYLYFLERI